MTHQEGFFTNKQDQSIYYQYWLPERTPQAALLLIHGLNEHSSRYVHFAKYFTQKDFAVFALDQIGHGNSEGTRSFVTKFSCLIDDLMIYLGIIRGLFPDTPVFPVGHSLGGLITSYFLLDHQDLVSGAILSGSVVLVPEYVSSFTILMGNILSAILPKLGLLGIDKTSLSRDPAVIEAYLNDPLVHNGKTTARISSEMNSAINRIDKEVSVITSPVLILHGGADKLVDPACSRFLYESLSSEDKKLIIYEGFFHEIYNEPEKDQVLNDVHTWLKKHLV